MSDKDGLKTYEQPFLTQRDKDAWDAMIAAGRVESELASEIAQRVETDPLLGRIDAHLKEGGFNNWKARYLLIGALEELCARNK